MKIRASFVSNSSSTSFCIYGTRIESSELCDLLKIDPEEVDSVFDRVYDLARKLDLDVYAGSDDGLYYIGESFTTIGDNETGLQFKVRVKAQIEKLLGSSGYDLGIHEETVSS
jgi:hypothetical protein